MAELHDLPVRDIDAAVSTRLQRQQLLYDSRKQFTFLLAEPVPRWQFCPPAVMRGQLDRLLAVIGLPNLRLGILPLDRPLRTAPQNSFQIYGELAMVETFVGESTHNPAESSNCHRILDLLWADAETGEATRQLIVAAANSLSDPSKTQS